MSTLIVIIFEKQFLIVSFVICKLCSAIYHQYFYINVTFKKADALSCVINDYNNNNNFNGMILLYEAEEEQKRFRVTAGVPQGSMLCPIYWKAMYDYLLRLPPSMGSMANRCWK